MLKKKIEELDRRLQEEKQKDHGRMEATDLTKILIKKRGVYAAFSLDAASAPSETLKQIQGRV